MTVLSIIPTDAVVIRQDEIRTTSLKVAEAFGKRHSHVLRAIENMDCSPEFSSAHFWAHAEKIMAGAVQRNSKYYEMTKDGFMFLVMGFTGKKAAQVKEAYINAFNWMADKLKKKSFSKTSTDERTGLRNAVNLLVSKKGLMYPEAYNLIHHRFNVGHLDELSKDQLPEAVEYVHRLALEGEYLPRQEPQPEFVLSEAQAKRLLLLLHHADWVNHRWCQGIGRGVQAINKELYAKTVEHVQTMARMGRSLDHELGHLRKTLSISGQRPA